MTHFRNLLCSAVLFTLAGTAAAQTPPWTNASGVTYTTTPTDKVVIGDTTTTFPLDVVSSIDGPTVRFKSSSQIYGAQFSLASTYGDEYRILSTPSGNGAVGAGKLCFVHMSGASGQYFLVLDNSGNMGVGVNAPAAKLDVSGNVHASGSITADGAIAAKYADVAEWVPASESLPPGTLVALDPTRNNTVGRSQHAYDTNVAGVISPQPGLMLGEPGASKVLVATTGRVRVHVTAANGGVAIGDLLVASDHPGVAMKSLPLDLGGVKIHRPGTIMGKALEPLPSGEGEILVLLTLQ
jgi:hypothetical protein